jgi:hypothetical protein
MDNPITTPAPSVDDLLIRMAQGATTPAPEPAVSQPEEEEEVVPAAPVQEPDAVPSVDDQALTSPEEDDSLDWDDDQEEIIPPVAAATEGDEEYFDFKAVSDAFGEAVEDEQSIVAAVAKLKEQAATQALADVPEALRKAVAFAKNGGDYLAMLQVAEQSYDGYTDRELAAHELRTYFPEGEEGDQQLDEYLEGLTDAQIRIQGQQTRRALEAARQQTIQRMEQEARMQKQENDKRLKDTLSNLSEIEKMPLGDKHKQQLYQRISSPDFLRSLFYDKDGNLDFSKVARHAFIDMYGDKVEKFRERKIKVSTKQEVLRDTQNVQTRKNAAPSGVQVDRSGLDLLMDQFKPKL